MTKHTKPGHRLIYTGLIITVVSILAGLITAPIAHGQQPYTYFFPLFFDYRPAFASTSYYMTTLNNQHIYNLGCQLGTRDKNTPGTQNSVVVLAFGYPRCFNSGGYGANLFGYGPATINNVSNVVKQFALGYYNCTGSDNKSNLVIGAGTSNYLGGTEPCDTQAKAKAHGTAWSGMVRDLNLWAKSQGIFHQVQVYGANDIELGWNTPGWTRAWVNGFEQVSGNFMLYFGDAAGCPYDTQPGWQCGTSTYPEWSLEDVWYVSYGAPSALPLPLIYLTNGVHAKQWAFLSRYSVAQHGFRINFAGIMTQWAYCQQFSWCNTTDNTPEMAYQQMIFELGKSPATAQDIRWRTDIRWIMQNEISSLTSPEDEIHEDWGNHPTQDEAERLADTLRTQSVSSELQSSLESKQRTYQDMAEMAAQSQNDPAPKDDLHPMLTSDTTHAAFISGIIQNGEIPGLPYGVEINQVWQGITANGYLQVAAGSSPEHSQQGALYILLGTFDQTYFQSKMITAPENCGALSILDENEGFLKVQSFDGCDFTFDFDTWVLTPTND